MEGDAYAAASRSVKGKGALHADGKGLQTGSQQVSKGKGEAAREGLLGG